MVMLRVDDNVKDEGVRLGQIVKHRLTGFRGTVNARTTFLSGCVRIGVIASKLKDGEPNEQWFDENQLEVISAKPAEKKPPTGGSHTPPAGRDCPTR